MIRFVAIVLVATALGASQVAFAAGACRPTRDGKDRIERAGGCPSGYFVRGACCESFHATAPTTAPGVKTCPAGSSLKLGVCVPGL